MSYLGRLIAQTGINLVAASPRAEPVSPIVEIDVQQITVPPTPVQVEPLARTLLSESASTVLPARIERVEDVVTTREPTPSQFSQSIPQVSSPPAPRASPVEPFIPEIVIEQRPTVVKVEPAPMSVSQQPTREAPSDQSVATVAPAQKNVEPLPENRQTATTQNRPTFFEIRNWVTGTPVADETPAESNTTKPDIRSAVAPPERVTVTRETSPIPHAMAERVVPPEETHVELSIGTMQVVVEAPPSATPPARLQPPPTAQAAAAPPSWSRLSRRYVRL